MDTTDDPATLAIAAATVYTATQAGRGGGGGRIPKAEAKKTAEPTVQLSEQAKRNRRLAASSLTRDWAEPTLGTPGLLGG